MIKIDRFLIEELNKKGYKFTIESLMDIYIDSAIRLHHENLVQSGINNGYTIEQTEDMLKKHYDKVRENAKNGNRLIKNNIPFIEELNRNGYDFTFKSFMDIYRLSIENRDLAKKRVYEEKKQKRIPTKIYKHQATEEFIKLHEERIQKRIAKGYTKEQAENELKNIYKELEENRNKLICYIREKK